MCRLNNHHKMGYVWWGWRDKWNRIVKFWNHVSFCMSIIPPFVLLHRLSVHHTIDERAQIQSRNGIYETTFDVIIFHNNGRWLLRVVTFCVFGRVGDADREQPALHRIDVTRQLKIGHCHLYVSSYLPMAVDKVGISWWRRLADKLVQHIEEDSLLF